MKARPIGSDSRESKTQLRNECNCIQKRRIELASIWMHKTCNNEVTMFTKLSPIVAVIALVGVGCSSQLPTEPDQALTSENAVTSRAISSHVAQAGNNVETVMFKVRIENVSNSTTLHLSNGQTAPVPISPGLWTVTRQLNPLFKIGQVDPGFGMEHLAEDGDPSTLAANMAANPEVKASGVFTTPVGGAGPAPAFPGDAYEFTFSAETGDGLSLATMFVQSNDLFYSPGRVAIPLFHRSRAPISGDITHYFRLWDAGTEVNQEPGLGAEQAPRQSGPNTGESESKRVRMVQDGYTYPETGEVIKVTITPIS